MAELQSQPYEQKEEEVTWIENWMGLGGMLLWPINELCKCMGFGDVLGYDEAAVGEVDE